MRISAKYINVYLFYLENTTGTVYFDDASLTMIKNKTYAQNFLYSCLFIFISCLSYGQSTKQTDRVIIKLKNQNIFPTTEKREQAMIGNSKIDSVSKKFHATKIKSQLMGRKSEQFIHIIQFPEGTNIQQVIDEYNQSKEVEYAEPDYIGSCSGEQEIIPNDQYFNQQWALNNDGTFFNSLPGADIDMENAWSIERGDSNIVVGIIDTGAKLDHPEFAGRIWINYKEIPNNGIDDDNNSYIDDVEGWNFVYDNNNSTDDDGHGTNVTGIIGANGNNSIGYAGIDWNCKLMILKGLDSTGYGYYSWWASAIYYAVDNGAKVINMSVKGSSSPVTLQNAIDYAFSKNVTVVACMGNENSSSPDYPAAYDHVIAVGATNPNDTRVDQFCSKGEIGSNFGSHISVVAPGNYIYGLNNLSDTNYGYYWCGTSQATPHVSGLATLLLAQNPNRTPTQIKSIIEAAAEDEVGNPIEDTKGWDKYYGYGRINAFYALRGGTSSGEVTLYPNPVDDILTIIGLHNITNSQLTDVMGREFKIELSWSDNGYQANVQGLTSGMYLLRLQDGQALKYVKFIKK